MHYEKYFALETARNLMSSNSIDVNCFHCYTTCDSDVMMLIKVVSSCHQLGINTIEYQVSWAHILLLGTHAHHNNTFNCISYHLLFYFRSFLIEQKEFQFTIIENITSNSKAFEFNAYVLSFIWKYKLLCSTTNIKPKVIVLKPHSDEFSVR
ncbi:CLUMA_CG002317, isoform A [Clunio marinus]|uniref:CLUMA_CG002317, isoform A n=1 Tax=Clunio marinus TaxID=568069 RepID=A0A1J1HKH5_9DIPT|nr:CLUMA_CG002317, isoform A [Clunio marinus]